jgi:hypothetical protein
MNMPSRNGNGVHQIIVEPKGSQTLADFVYAINDTNFIIVNEFYKDNDGSSKGSNYYSVGPICLNTAFIGKIKEYVF